MEFVVCPFAIFICRPSGTVNTEIPPRQAWESWMLKKPTVFSFLDEVQRQNEQGIKIGTAKLQEEEGNIIR